MECHECGATISDKAADCPQCGTSVSDVSPSDTQRSDAAGKRGTSASGRSEIESGADADSEAEPVADAGTETERRTGERTVGGQTADQPEREEALDDSAASDEGSVESRRRERSSAGERDGEQPASGQPSVDRPPDAEQPETGAGEPADSSGSASGSESGDAARSPTERDNETGARTERDDEAGSTTEREGAGQSAPGDGDGSREPTDHPSGQPAGQSADAGEPPGQGADAGQPTGESAGRHTGGTAGQPAGRGGGQSVPQGEGQSPGQTGGRSAGQGDGQGGDGGGQPGDQEGGHGTDRSVDPAALLGDLPLFPGAAAGFASAVVVFGVAVAVAAVMPFDADSTLGLGAVVFFDLHFATPTHVTPSLYGIFEILRPPDAALGLLYLLAPIALYTAAKLVVTFNGEPDATLAASALAGATVLVGYLPVAVAAFLVVPSTGPNGPSAAAAILLAGVVYPFLFGALGGVAVGGFASGERRVGTVYALGVAFFLVVGVFLTTFLSLTVSTVEVDLLTRVLVTLFSVAGLNTLSLGQGQASSVLPFVFGFGIFGVAGFLRAWRAAPLDTPLEGARKGVTLALTYAVIAGVLLTMLPVFADPYVQDAIGMGLLASTFVETIVQARLGTIGQYASAVFKGTLVYPVVLGGTGGAIAAAIRDDGRSSRADQ